jgi:hypothetical protein
VVRNGAPSATKGNALQSIRTNLQARQWPVLIAAFLVGSLLGLLFSLVTPPIYQSTAAIAINIDYGRTQPLELIVEDRALDRVWQFLVSDEMLVLTRERLQSSEGPDEAWESLGALRSHARLEQRLSRWELHGIHRDPPQAAAIANAWAAISLERLQEAQAHAWKAVQLQGAPFLVQCFALHSEGVAPDALWECVASGPELTSEAVDVLRAEVEASHGILPNLAYELTESAGVPEKPVLWSRGLPVLAGGIAGLAVAMIVSSKLRLPAGISDQSDLGPV